MSATWVRSFLARQRLALWSAAILALTLLIIGALLMAALEANLRREVDEALLLRAQHVEHGITVDQDGALSAAAASPGLADLAPLDEITAPGIYVQVVDPTGAVLLSSANLPGAGLPVPADLAQQTLAGRQTYATVPLGPERVRLLGWPVLQPAAGSAPSSWVSRCTSWTSPCGICGSYWAWRPSWPCCWRWPAVGGCGARPCVPWLK